MKPVRAPRIAAVLGAVLALLLAGCGGGSSGQQTVRIALDWTPNTNHTGLFVAQQEGWFREAGLDVQFLPYNNTSPDTLVSSGAAEFGISFQDSFTFSKAAGAEITSVMAVLQHWATQIAVRADRADITSPRDLDGKTYGGFGAAYEEPKMRAVIQDAGGTGTFRTVVLGTAAYEALYAGEVDFTEPFVAWEGIEAELRGQPLKTFSYTDYGFPDAYNVLLIGNSPWLRDHPDLAAKFVQAAQRGYQLAADDPDRAAQLLIDANPGAFSEPELVTRSQHMLAERFLRDENGRVGTQTPERWAGYSGWVFDSGVLTGPDGAPLTQRPDFTTWFTDDYLAPPA
ncbi:ABC transporter substrate-binding protein [Pseudonocardia cypriaca]|uniref:Thiamine pyrimidine synthase n=1 Tax=Pseudonocardia cypriaca TaxID=882449 RepID=A0A543FU64_9PSEU|nr:ABC transporter substrate-binding protein [Pseudonocardia cypriaca]TQM37387.1 ABC-type nitrate/sulfonate/bicarbonate transport system substrate-binding protein [Pseudonocardia cypriaca]